MDTALIEDVWDRHTMSEFVTADVDATMATMTDNPSVLHVPTSIGARGRSAVREFYQDYFIGHQASDMSLQLLTRTVTAQCLVDEIVISLTHDAVIPWLLPGVAPTGQRVRVPIVTVIGMQEGLVHTEHIYWDQASVLAQVGILDSTELPITKGDQADPLAPDAPPTSFNRLLGAPS
ncbi:MAG: nuclear transport factor 2 family protein [Acidimicrobiales bacterium]